MGNDQAPAFPGLTGVPSRTAIGVGLDFPPASFPQNRPIGSVDGVFDDGEPVLAAVPFSGGRDGALRGWAAGLCSGRCHHDDAGRDLGRERGDHGCMGQRGDADRDGDGRNDAGDAGASEVLRCDGGVLRGHPPSGHGANDGAGTATIKFRPAVGSHSYNAVFLGTNAYAGSTSGAAALTVDGVTPSTTTIAESGSVGNYTLTATVGVSGAVAATGTVSFLDIGNGNAVLGTAPLEAGAAGFSFLNASVLNTGGSPAFVSVADFNGDGIPDLAVTNAGSSTVTVLLGNGDGTFTAAAMSPPTGSEPESIVAGDFNGDGIPDLAVVNNGSNTVTILLGNGDGTFTATATSPGTGNDPWGIAVGDFNGDGIPDLAVTNLCGGDPDCISGGSITILLGNGDGTFTPVTISPATGWEPVSIAVGDFNGDGMQDLAVANNGSNTVTILLGNGEGAFRALPGPVLSSRFFNLPSYIVAGDFNGDGVPDLAVTNAGSNTVTVLLGIGGVKFNFAGNLTVGLSPEFVTVGDFNGDGIPDLAVANAGSNTATVLLGLGDGTFATTATSPGTGSAPYAIAAGDFNGDGLADLAIADYGSDDVRVLMAEKQTAMATATGISLSNGLQQVEASYPGDSNYAASNSGAITVGEPIAPLTLTVTPSSLTITLIQALTVTVSVSVPAGSPAPTGLVTLSAGSYAPAAAMLSGGVATFDFPAGTLAAGSDTLTANYMPDAASSSDYASSTASSTVVVTVAQPALALSVSPADSALGQAVTLTATLSGYDAQQINGESINFFSNGVSIGSGTIASGVATLTVSSLNMGVDALTASYSGDVNNSAASANSVLEYVAQAGQGIPGVTLAVTSAGAAASSVAAGTVVTLTAAVSLAGAPVAPGAVTFCDTAMSASCSGAGYLGSAQLTSSGTAVLALRLGIGTHALQAIFNGTASVGGGVSSASGLTVAGPRASSTYLTNSTPNIYSVTPEVMGGAVFAPPYPTGTVQIIDTSASNAVLSTQLLTTFGKSTNGSFNTMTQTPATGAKPVAIAAGDFNQDGIPDLAVANSGDNTVSILLGNGDGSFKPQTTYATGNGTYTVATGDFNGDGNLDLAVANSSDNTVSILLGNGDGSFQAQTAYGTGGGPDAIAVGDFNGDGNLDLAVANSSDGTVSILLGNGDGTFQAQQAYATGNGPASIAAGDFNGDGNLDLAVANSSAGTVSILLGKGDGSFRSQTPYKTGNQPVSVTAGNLNGDGALDLAVANLADNTVSVLMGNGDGTFKSQVTYQAGQSPNAVVANNFAELGPQDLLVENSGTNSVTLMVNNGNGTYKLNSFYTTVYTTGFSPIAFAAADLNGDGIEDLAVLKNSANAVTVLIGATLYYAASAASNINLPGTHVLKAVYSGDANFGGSTSAGLTMVNPVEATTLTLASNENPSNYGDPVTLTATLSPYATQDVQQQRRDRNVWKPGYGHADERRGHADHEHAAGGHKHDCGVVWRRQQIVCVHERRVPAGGGACVIDGDGLKREPYLRHGQPCAERHGERSRERRCVYRNGNDHGHARQPARQLPGDADGERDQSMGLHCERGKWNVDCKSGGADGDGIECQPHLWHGEPALSATVSGAVNGDTFTVSATTTATQGSPPGSYPVTPAVSGANLSDYIVSGGNGTLTVNPAALTVTGSSASRTYGMANPALTGTVDGAMNGDTFTATATTTATESSPVGSYPVTPAVSGTNLSDYTVNTVGGTLTVTPAALTVTVSSASRTYGTANPALSATVSGAVSGDTFNATATTTATQGSPTGSYQVTATISGANLTNYTVNTVNGTLTVGPAGLMMTGPSASRTYGSPNPALSGTVSGAVNGDMFTVTATTTATRGSPPGSYTVTPAVSGTNLSDYTVSAVNGTLTVNPAGLTVTGPSASRTYGTANPALNGTVSGAVNGDTFTVTAATTATQSSPPGSYPVTATVSGTNLSDYIVTTVKGALRVKEAALTVTGSSASRTYGTPNPTLSATLSGAVNGDAFTVTVATMATPRSPVGSYRVTPTVSGANLSDYTVNIVDGTLTVEPATLRVLGPNASRSYGKAIPCFTGRRAER